MPIIEIVCAIIGAFTGGLTVFQGHKAAKRDKESLALSRSLSSGSSSVQSEYDRHYNRMGERFARGDGKSPSRP
jgi:hypothetical protein